MQISTVVVLAPENQRRASGDEFFHSRFSCLPYLRGLAAGVDAAYGAGPLLIAYGGHNETMAPIWVGIEKGLFRKHGVDPRALQTRSGPIMMATLASGGAALVSAAPGSAISTSTGGMKLTCFAAGNNAMPRELIVRKGIESIEDLRGKTFGVQSIGGGFWLSTMVALDALGSIPKSISSACASSVTPPP